MSEISPENSRFLLSIMTTYVRKDPPQLEEVLEVVRELRGDFPALFTIQISNSSFPSISKTSTWLIYLFPISPAKKCIQISNRQRSRSRPLRPRSHHQTSHRRRRPQIRRMACRRRQTVRHRPGNLRLWSRCHGGTEITERSQRIFALSVRIAKDGEVLPEIHDRSGAGKVRNV